MRHSFVLPNQKIETGKFDEKSLLTYVVGNGVVELFDFFVWCRCMHKSCVFNVLVVLTEPMRRSYFIFKIHFLAESKAGL